MSYNPHPELENIILRDANIPARYREPVDFDPRKHAGWAAAFDSALLHLSPLKKGVVVILCGDRGTGKTRMAAELIYILSRSLRFFCRYEVFTDYLDAIHAKITADEHHNRYLTPRMLVLDEIAKAGDSAWTENRLFHLVNTRYNDLKHTVLITAAAPEGLGNILGPSVLDRIHEGGAVIHLNWPSFRSHKP